MACFFLNSLLRRQVATWYCKALIVLFQKVSLKFQTYWLWMYSHLEVSHIEFICFSFQVKTWREIGYKGGMLFIYLFYNDHMIFFTLK